VSTDLGPRQGSESGRSRVTEAIVDFLEALGVTSYAVTREPSSITLLLPNEPESSVERHFEGLRDRLQEIVIRSDAHAPLDFVSRDPRDQHAIIVNITPAGDERSARDSLVQRLQNEEGELRRRGIESLILFGSSSTMKPNPHDVDLLARFQRDARLSAFDLADIQLYLERRLGRRVDLANEKLLPAAFLAGVERTGIRIFGSR
jgi:predicted nucleotidyltransferase